MLVVDVFVFVVVVLIETRPSPLFSSSFSLSLPPFFFLSPPLLSLKKEAPERPLLPYWGCSAAGGGASVGCGAGGGAGAAAAAAAGLALLAR